MPVVWTKEYSIGIEEMDKQHQRLLVLINRVEIVSQMDSKRDDFKDKCLEVIQDVINYTVLHFASEEVLLRMFEYPDYVEHKNTHDKFVAFINKKQLHAQSLFANGKHDEMNLELDDLYQFLKKWLLGHIMKTDTEYTKFFLDITRKAKKGSGLFGFFKS